MVSFKGHREGSIYLEESSRRRWDEESRSKEREEPATKKAKQNDDEESSYNDSIDDDDDNSDVSDELECFQFFYFHIMFVPQQPNDDTQQENKPIGFIRAEIIDRSRIRNGYFSEYMDAHSGEMQWLTAVLFDEGGRTQLPALALYDAYGPSFLVISQLSIVDAAFYADREDIETIAIHQLLNHPEIKQEHPITSAYCLLYDFDLYELKQRTPNFENQKPCPHRLRKNADAYLRNGFFQDPVYLTEEDNA
ncbi:hypothetical protein FisN_26Hu155 [Fistulifera solaris]|uniref:Uncharacterized protein n=1 Tax=Fistulifera solaris TaxID=1519565 RepID=A0A1Z5JXU9_FISSO|nr:hypothetical protein FisN_26Hu155 [Fistulifera solaris]|eukprot:GAX18853.1 hypothetical protein FisN_26Hu155 [Fistulifera solaris]